MRRVGVWSLLFAIALSAQTTAPEVAIRTHATLDAPPGIYQVRTIVREAMKGALAAATTAVELRA